MDTRGAGSIGGLVFLIAIFIILYVLVMPPCEKCQLLNQGDCGDVCDEESFEGVLLHDSLGIAKSDDLVTHNLDPVSLYIRADDEVENLADSLFVNRGWFGNVDQDLNFVLDDLDNLEDVFFSFRVDEAKGTLYIELNGRTIFSEKLSKGGSKVINLPTSYLEEDNYLKIYVDSPGLAFWIKNKYSLANLQIRQEFETVHYEEKRFFSMSGNERENLESANLEFSVFCSGAEGLTILKTYLNDDLLSSESIECQSFDKSIPLNRDLLTTGENEIKFVIDNGNFLLSPVEIVSNLDREIYPSYHFKVESSVYAFADDYHLSMKLGEGQKTAKIIINNYNLDLDTSQTYFDREITSFIKEGNNFIEIVPANEFKVDEIKVWYE